MEVRHYSIFIISSSYTVSVSEKSGEGGRHSFREILKERHVLRDLFEGRPTFSH